MRYFVLGAGLAGKEIARVLRAQGHEVLGTTTTPAKVDGLREFFDDVRVLRGSDTDLITEALDGVDGVVVSAGPPALFDEAEREVAYRAALVDTAESIVTAVRDAGMTGPVVAMSSTSVYGSAQNDRDVITEDGPLAARDLASPRNFQLMEDIYTGAIPDQACIFRCVEIYGENDTPVETQLLMVQQAMGGRLPFAHDALLYRTEVGQVAEAIAHALTTRMHGIYNLAGSVVPQTISERCDPIAEANGWPAFTYLGELANPTKPLSVERLTAAGFAFSEPAPAPTAPSAPALDHSGRELVLAMLDRIVGELGLTEQLGSDGDAALPVNAVGGPLDGQRIGEFRVYGRDDGVRVVYSKLSIDSFGMDTHQIYAFGAVDSAVPHLFLDTAIAPNTEGTFHYGLDLVPRVDLGANLDYTVAVFRPLDEARADALARPGVMPVPSLGPLQWSIRSPWMVAAIVAPEDLTKLGDITDVYVTRWLDVAANGLDDSVQDSIAWQDLAERDRRSREAIFSPATNPVWNLLDKLVGEQTAGAMRDLLIGR